MDEKERTIQDAIQLYEAGDYTEAGVVCMELKKKGENLKEANLLLAKSILNFTNSAVDEEHTKAFLIIAAELFSSASSVEEFYNFDYELRSELNEWKRKRLRAATNSLINTPEQCLDVLDNYTKYANLTRDLALTMASFPPDKNYITDELYSKYKKDISNPFTDEEYYEYVYEAAWSIFTKARAVLLSNNTGSMEYIKSVIHSDVFRYVFVYTIPMMEYALVTHGEIKSTDFNKLAGYAEVLDFALDAKAYPNGSEMSLFWGDNRQELRDKLVKVYSHMKALDEDFVIPSIPSASILEPNLPQSQSGGCYVATAVYGSYDCPEVWTLRRFRDYQLAESVLGRTFIKTYYFVSPHLVKWFGSTEWFSNIFKPILNKLVYKLKENGVEDTPYNDREW